MARDKARAARQLVERKVDPILQRQQARSLLRAREAVRKQAHRRSYVKFLVFHFEASFSRCRNEFGFHLLRRICLKHGARRIGSEVEHASDRARRPGAVAGEPAWYRSGKRGANQSPNRLRTTGEGR